MTEHRRQMAEALSVLRINGNFRFSWFGRRSPSLPKSLRAAVEPDTLRAFLTSSVQFRLYGDFYLHGRPVPTRQRQGGNPDVGLTSFVRALSEANQGAGHWERGWQPEEQREEFWRVARGGLAVFAPVSACRSVDIEDAAGDGVEVLFPKEFLGMSPGFYMAVGNEDLPRDESLLRVYWNISPRGAVALMAGATGVLNAACIPFRLKAANSPHRYDRCDSAVLYLPINHAEEALRLLTPVSKDLGCHLSSWVPAFTRQVSHGIALAEDPGLRESFGLHRCKLVAEALVTAHGDGVSTPSELLCRVAARFDEEGLSLDAPYLNRGSSGLPDPGWAIDTRGLLPGRPQMPASPDWLLMARQIATRLCATAHRHKDRCTWVGREAAAASPHGDEFGQVLRSLGPSLYSGTAGIAWFLSEFAAMTEDQDVAKLAHAALRQTLARADTLEGSQRFGFFSGHPGIVFAAMRGGGLLGEQQFVEGATQLAESLVESLYEEAEVDVMSGLSGAILGLLAAADITGTPELLKLAADLGRRLIAEAQTSGNHLSWKSLADPEERPLTGLSHGASGIGLALLRLFAATDDAVFLDAGEAALRHEQAQYDGVARNWPDYRGISRRISMKAIPRMFSAFWCHGAPGIALARLQACEITGDPGYGEHAGVALGTTHDALLRTLERGAEADVSLCHGVCGNFDILKSASARMGINLSGADNLEARIHWLLTERLAESGDEDASSKRPLPPGLMLGLAGIGIFCMRRLTGGVPNILSLELQGTGCTMYSIKADSNGRFRGLRAPIIRHRSPRP